MKTTIGLALKVIGGLSLLVSLPALAHHSFAAAYDENSPINKEGVVTKVELTNPHSWLWVDVTNEDEWLHAVESTVARFSRLDVLVNNAGFSSKVRSTRHIGAEEWRSVMDINTLGPAMLTRALLAPMIKKGSGHVVMISSMAAIRPGVMAGAVYSSAKSASRAYMDVLAAEVRQHGIRCTTILPGEVDTPILDNRALPPDEEARSLMMQPEDISAAVMMAVSLPQRANVLEIAITATAPRDMSKDIEAALLRRD